MRRDPYQSVISRAVAGWLIARCGPSAIRYQLLVDLHVFEAVVRQTVDEESLDIAAPAGGRASAGARRDRRRIRVDLLDLGVQRRALRRVLRAVILRDLVVPVAAAVASPILAPACSA